MKRRVLSLFLAVLMVFALAVPAWAEATYTANWKMDSAGKWTVTDGDGKLIKNAWICDDGVAANGKEVWYLVDAEGCLVTAPLIKDSAGNYYSLETGHNGYFGMLRNKSGVYDGIALNINSTHDGTFGKLLDKASIDALAAKYGVKEIDTTATKIICTSQLKKTVTYSDDSSSGSYTVPTDYTFTVPETDGVYSYGWATLAVTGNGTEALYENTSGKAQTARITTVSGQSLTIDAPKDDVYHYGEADFVTILAVANSSYNGFAETAVMSIESGHAILSAPVDEVLVTPEKAVKLDVAADSVISLIDVASPSEAQRSQKNGVDINVTGAVTAIRSEIGEITLTVDPSAPVVPKLEFVGSEALLVYEQNILQKSKEQGGFKGQIRCGDEIINVSCGVNEETKEIEAFSVTDRTFTEDVIVTGDFIKVDFKACTFEGDIINRGNEQTVVRFMPGCTFAADSACYFENNGRPGTVDDLLPKFMFIVVEPIPVHGEGVNGAVIGAENFKTDRTGVNPVIYDEDRYNIEDVKYYQDERLTSSVRTMQDYAGQPVNILYVNHFNALDEAGDIVVKSVTLAERSTTEDKKQWAPTSGKEEEPILYAYIKLNGEKKERSFYIENFDETFTFKDETISEDYVIEAPYNKVTFKNCSFSGTVTVKGNYAEVIFDSCTLPYGGVTKDEDSKEITVTVK